MENVTYFLSYNLPLSGIRFVRIARYVRGQVQIGNIDKDALRWDGFALEYIYHRATKSSFS